jgi:hypothetical protein
MNDSGLLFPFFEPLSTILRPLISSQNFYWTSRLSLDLPTELNDVGGGFTSLPQEFCGGKFCLLIILQQ